MLRVLRSQLLVSDKSELHSRPRRPSSAAQLIPPPEEFALSDTGDHSDALSDADADESGVSAGLLGGHRARKHRHRAPHIPPSWARWLFRYPSSASARRKPRVLRRTCAYALCRRFIQLCGFLGVASIAVLVFTAIFRPSYTRAQYPASWRALEERVQEGGGINPPGLWTHPPGEKGRKKLTAPGRGNPQNERIFIAANIVNAALIESEWGERVMELMDLLGEENVFLSVFENDSGPETKRALDTLSSRIRAHMPLAGQSIVSTTLPFSGVPRLRVGRDESYIKRVAYLAEVRNRALLPLVGDIPSLARWNQSGNPASTSPPQHEPPLSDWEFLAPLPASDIPRKPAMPPAWVDAPETVARILFLNDVVFDPVQLLHLLFSTNSGDYAAACAVDFINPFKFYDAFATRDTAGYPIGVPFFPYFATALPRSQIMSQAPAVPVGSCWGGAIAFDASHFTRASPPPVRFRAEKEPFWDASECCLVHADIAQPNRTFFNPFVRTAYDRTTFDWLPFVRRVERAFALPHRLVVWGLGMPWPGMRRGEKEGERVRDVRWDDGEWVAGERIAGKGGWCGSRKLLVMNEDPGEGERGWRGVTVPMLP